MDIGDIQDDSLRELAKACEDSVYGNIIIDIEDALNESSTDEELIRNLHNKFLFTLSLINQKLKILESLKKVKSPPERLHDVFVKSGYAEWNETTALETTVALLIDDIIQEVRESCKKP